MIKFLLVDDHFIIRIGLKLVIEKWLPFSRFDEVSDGASTLEKIQNYQYDLLILDAHMPDTDPRRLVTNILRLKPKLKILMFSTQDEKVYAKKYLRMGIMGYLQKDAAEADIIEAVTTLLNNRKYISPALNQLLISDTRDNKPENPFNSLSPREFEIARYLVGGKSIAEICRKLSLHSSTVSTLKGRIFKKLPCSNVIELNSLAKVYRII